MKRPHSEFEHPRIPGWLSSKLRHSPQLQLRRCDDWGPATHLLEPYGEMFVDMDGSTLKIDMMGIRVAIAGVYVYLESSLNIESKSSRSSGCYC